MKKILSAILVLCLCFGIGTAAMAAGIENFAPNTQYGNFTDVSKSDWYYESVRTANEYGLVKGNPDGSFNPDGSLTVAEAIVTADRIHMIYNTGEASLANGDPWYQTYVDYAIENDIIGKKDFDDYTRPVTRAEMAYIFSGAVPYDDFEEVNEPGNAIAPDIDGHKYEKAIKLLYQYGIVTGNDIYGTFTPDSNIKRSEMSALISRVVVPEQRRAFMLLENYEADGITVAVPVGSVAQQTEIPGYDECVDIMYQDAAGVAIYRSANITGGVDGLSVLNIPRDAQAKEIEAAMGVSVESHTLSFGSVPAYRFDFTMDAGSGLEIAGCYYVTIIGHDLYSIVVMMPYPAGGFDGPFASTYYNMVNNVSINGAAPSEKVG